MLQYTVLGMCIKLDETIEQIRISTIKFTYILKWRWIPVSEINQQVWSWRRHKVYRNCLILVCMDVFTAIEVVMLQIISVWNKWGKGILKLSRISDQSLAYHCTSVWTQYQCLH